MSEVWRSWDNATRLLDVMLNPFKYAVDWSLPLGGAQFVASVIGFSIILYTWWHTKEALAAGLAGVLVGIVFLMWPELRLIAYVLAALGASLLAYEVLQQVTRI